MREYIIIVDETNQELGRAEKIEAHQSGVLHRAFSILIFNNQKQLLLQKRAKSKYHSGGLWTNTCCSHPKPGEDIQAAAHRRLQEEMGFDCELTEVFAFVYRAELDNGLVENEYDHVFVGTYDGQVSPNREEVEDIRWADLEEIRSDVTKNPHLYTYWFRCLIERV